jgi:hypothetical protein
MRLREISDLLPEAHFIHIIRDGRDVAISLRLMWHTPGQDMRTLATYWKTLIQDARRDAAEGVHYLEIRYEELIRDPQAALRSVCRFLELPFSDEMLTYHRSARERLDEVTSWVDADGRMIFSREDRFHAHRYTSRPPAVERIGRWRAEMTAAEIQEFESVAGDMLEELGYVGSSV